MTRYSTVSQADIDDGVARGRQLRSNYLADRAHELTRALIRRLRRRETARHLDDLPDYLLRDIGIERHQIPALAAGALRRPKSNLAAVVGRRITGIFQPKPATADAANDRHSLAA